MPTLVGGTTKCSPLSSARGTRTAVFRHPPLRVVKIGASQGSCRPQRPTGVVPSPRISGTQPQSDRGVDITGGVPRPTETLPQASALLKKGLTLLLVGHLGQ